MVFTKIGGHWLVLCRDMRIMRMDRANAPR